MNSSFVINPSSLRYLIHGQLHYGIDFAAVGGVGPEAVKTGSQRRLGFEKCAHGRSGFRALGSGIGYTDRVVNDAEVGRVERGVKMDGIDFEGAITGLRGVWESGRAGDLRLFLIELV